MQGNKINRKLSRSHVDYLKRQILNKFPLTGETVKFDWNGDMIDGQHRLQAIIETGVAVETVVVRNLDPAVRDFIDVGKVRTGANALDMEGIPNSAAVASCVRWLLHYEDCRFNRERMNRISPGQVVDEVLEHPEYAVTAQLSHGTRHLTNMGMATALRVLFDRVDQAESAKFWDDLKTGVGLQPHDPVLRLREKLMRNKMQKHRAGSIEQAAWIVKAWNARRRRRQISLFKHTVGQTDFPVIR
jgi:hypothetical protein